MEIQFKLEILSKSINDKIDSYISEDKLRFLSDLEKKCQVKEKQILLDFSMKENIEEETEKQIREQLEIALQILIEEISYFLTIDFCKFY